MTGRADLVGLGFDAGDEIVVTGGASGIGYATSLIAGAHGLDVTVWDLDRARAATVASEIEAQGGTASSAAVDVTDVTAICRAFAERFGSTGPRYLVNNAGPASSSGVDYSTGLLASAASVELVTSMWMACDLPAGASVVNVASVAGNVVGVAPAWYSSGKAAIAAYTRFLAVHCSSRVRANAVAPGLIATPRMTQFIESDVGRKIQSRIPLGRMGRADDVAWAIMFLLSPRAAYLAGTVVVVDGAWTLAQ